MLAREEPDVDAEAARILEQAIADNRDHPVGLWKHQRCGVAKALRARDDRIAALEAERLTMRDYMLKCMAAAIGATADAAIFGKSLSVERVQDVVIGSFAEAKKQRVAAVARAEAAERRLADADARIADLERELREQLPEEHD